MHELNKDSSNSAPSTDANANPYRSTAGFSVRAIHLLMSRIAMLQQLLGFDGNFYERLLYLRFALGTTAWPTYFKQIEGFRLWQTISKILFTQFKEVSETRPVRLPRPFSFHGRKICALPESVGNNDRTKTEGEDAFTLVRGIHGYGGVGVAG